MKRFSIYKPDEIQYDKISEVTNIVTHPLVVKCRHCGKEFVALVTDEEYAIMTNPKNYIMDLIPFGFDDDDRELILSCTCPECWDKLFKEEE